MITNLIDASNGVRIATIDDITFRYQENDVISVATDHINCLFTVIEYSEMLINPFGKQIMTITGKVSK